jgi:hypothetical protein
MVGVCSRGKEKKRKRVGCQYPLEGIMPPYDHKTTTHVLKVPPPPNNIMGENTNMGL